MRKRRKDRYSVDRLADPTPLPDEVLISEGSGQSKVRRHWGMTSGGTVVELAARSWTVQGTHEGMPVDGVGIVALAGPSWTAPAEHNVGRCPICTTTPQGTGDGVSLQEALDRAAGRLADEVAALPRTAHPTAIVSVTTADGTALLDLQVTGDLRTIAVVARTALAELAVREGA